MHILLTKQMATNAEIGIAVHINIAWRHDTMAPSR